MELSLKVDHAERIAALRVRCRERKLLAWTDTALVDAHSFHESEMVSSHILRIGLRTRDRLRHFRFELDDLELLVGRPALAPLELDQEALRQARAFLATLPFASTPGQTGHCELDRQILFEHGIDGALGMVQAYASAEQDPERRDTYQSFVYALEGLQVFVENAGSCARQNMADATPERQLELAEMARACEVCAHAAPQTFREAIQLLWLVDQAVAYADSAGLVSPGHLDRTLSHFYQRDLELGLLTQEDALALVESLYILINEFVPDGLAVAVMVAGADERGNDLTNGLSYLCLEALRRTKLVYPTVGICWTPQTPAGLVSLALELISQGFSNPAFFNDRTIRSGLQQYGIPKAESWKYINSTCVEITPVGSSNVWVASPYFPVCQFLLDEIASAANGSQIPPNFEEFLQVYFGRLGQAVEEAVKEQDSARRRREQFGGKPLQSVFTADCLGRGLDIDRGGARYNWIECSFVGLANLVDSLEVVRKEVYESGRVSFAGLQSLLESDFADHESERRRFLQAHEKYGNNAGTVEALMNRVVKTIQEQCGMHRVHPDGSYFVPGAFCWIMHEQLGKVCGATPDGRKAATPFADGCGPAQGRELRGPTAAILSTTSWDHTPLIGGAAYNMKFSKQLLQDETGRNGLKNLVFTFLNRGGFEVQVNVVDKDALQNARAYPEKYQDLVVRIGGYTDYFVRLSPRMQEELISRTEYSGF